MDHHPANWGKQRQLIDGSMGMPHEMLPSVHTGYTSSLGPMQRTQ